MSGCQTLIDSRKMLMSKLYANALGGKAWSLSELVFDLDDCLDNEGRPVSERRANMAIRTGVEMDMRVCPYSDKRNGQWMNMSALNQVSVHYTDVMATLLAFRQAQKAAGEDGWPAVQAAVIDLLLQPALARLPLGPQADAGRIPAQAAVAHKLGAGFFGILRLVNDRYASGLTLEFSVDAFLDFVERRDALIGAAEVCAGSPQMIRKTVLGLLEAQPVVAARTDGIRAARLAVARILALQVAVGTFWRLFDESHWFNLCCGGNQLQLQPCNSHLQQRIDFEHQSCPLICPQLSSASLPTGLLEAERLRLQQLLDNHLPAAELAADVERIQGLLAAGPTVVGYRGEAAVLVSRLALYLYGYRLFRQVLARLERDLRDALWQLPGIDGCGLDRMAAVNPGRMIFSIPRALPWYECLAGCRMNSEGFLQGSATGLRPVSRA
jgi:hypothetical protein